MKPEIVYLACPYSHKDPMVEQLRYEMSNRVAKKLIEEGHIVFSPVTHGHATRARISSGRWLELDLTFMPPCTRVVVIQAEGWSESTGVKAEMERAKELDIPVSFAYPESDDISKCRCGGDAVITSEKHVSRDNTFNVFSLKCRKCTSGISDPSYDKALMYWNLLNAD